MSKKITKEQLEKIGFKKNQGWGEEYFINGISRNGDYVNRIEVDFDNVEIFGNDNPTVFVYQWSVSEGFNEFVKDGKEVVITGRKDKIEFTNVITMKKLKSLVDLVIGND